MKHSGLTTEQVEHSRKTHGANVQRTSSAGNLSILFEVLREPMVILLLIACFFYFFMRQYQEGIIMAFAIILVAGISVFQQVRSENAIKTLNKLTRQFTTVKREGEQIEIPSEELVVGDLILVSEGQQVSADGKLIELNDLAVDESILTGESLAVNDKAVGDSIFSGTTVTSGAAWAKITDVGASTRLGQLGKSMEETIKGKTPLQIQVSSFVKKMAMFGVVAFLLVCVWNYLESGEAMNSLMHGLTLAMAVLPEEIPVALATFMALGAYRMIKNNVLAKHPQTVEALGAATVICVDKTGTITENKMTVSGIFDFRANELIGANHPVNTSTSEELLLIAMLASEEDPFDPMEKAIHEKYNAVFTLKKRYTKTKEYPLSGTHPMMTHVYEDENGNRIISCKGAPEGIIELSGLRVNEVEVIHKQLKQLAAEGNRVLAIGKGLYEKNKLPESQHDFRFEFLGLLALNDPPRKNMKEVIQRFYDSGIEVKMITGDYPETAKSIAAQISMRNSTECVTGKSVAEMSDQQLRDTLSTTTIFARVMPEIKLRIINTLKSMGEVVAMTGDGVNDGPALKSAHIGIAMGKRGSEVARKASSLVLVNDDLSNMVKAIAFGRNIYSNLKKAIQYIISIHIPLISVVTIPLLLGWKFPNLFSPVHVIFLELIMGPTCSIVYENEPMNEKLMKQKPRKMSDSLFNWRELSKSVIQGLVITGGLMILMYCLIETGSSETHTRTMVFTSLVLANILLTLSGRSATESVVKTIRYKNKLVPVIISITLLLLIASLTLNPIMSIFEFQTISTLNFLICLAVAFLSVMWIEVYKAIVSKSGK